MAALLTVASLPRVLAAEPEVRVSWEELAPLVEGRDVETVLTNGVHMRGRAMKVLAEEMEVRVKKTSDAALLPKGVRPIPRELFGALTVRWKQGPARALLIVSTVVGGPFALIGLHLGADDVGTAGAYALWGGVIAAGYLAGAKLDAKRLRIVLAPKSASIHAPLHEEQDCGSTEFEGGNPCIKQRLSQ